MKKQFFRVKQLADQTFLRAEKSKVLSDEELQIADHKVEYLRNVLTAINKKFTSSGHGSDIEKRAKRCHEFNLGTLFLEQCGKKRDSEIYDGEGDCKLFQDILREVGTIEQQLGKEYIEHELKVEDLISTPISKILDTDFPSVIKHKSNLKKYSLDKDSTNSRYQSTRKETLKDELEEADGKVEQCRDALAIDMFTILAKENELASYMLQLLKLQRGYHESALNNLQAVIPQLEKKIGHSSVKRVFGIPLNEHLSITGKRIAYPLEICITALTEMGMFEEGLFRLTGSTSKVKRLKASIDSGCFCEIIPEYRDVHVIASVLKLYLRELPEPLLTFQLYNEWMQLPNQSDNQRLEFIKNILRKLPKANMENLTYLIQFLSKLSQNVVNKMTPTNIAIVMSPNLLWAQSEDANVSMGNFSTTNMLVELFIKEVDELFKENVSQYVTPFNLFINYEERNFRSDTDHHVDLSTSYENLQTVDSPKPNTRKKKAAPGPPTSNLKNEQELLLDRTSLSSSYPSGSSTLSRTKESKSKSTVGTNTETSSNLLRRSSFNQEDKKQSKLKHDNLLVNNLEHKIVNLSGTNVSKTEPMQIPAQLTKEEKRYKTTMTHNINSTPSDKPVAAPRTFIEINDKNSITRNSSVRSSKNDCDEVQLRRPELVKPEIPARPPSLQQKRSSVELLDPTLHKANCSVYSVEKHHPSYVNIPNRNEKFQLGHDNQIAEKEKFLGHQPSEKIVPLPRTKLPDMNLERSSGMQQSISENFIENERRDRISDKPPIPADKPQHPPLPEKNHTVITAKKNELHQNISEEKHKINSSTVERPTTLPEKPKLIKNFSRTMNDKSKTKSNEKLDEKCLEHTNFSDNIKSSHSRTRSDGNLIDLTRLPTPPSPRSLNKPTEPPPPPPIFVKKLDGESTDM